MSPFSLLCCFNASSNTLISSHIPQSLPIFNNSSYYFHFPICSSHSAGHKTACFKVIENSYNVATQTAEPRPTEHFVGHRTSTCYYISLVLDPLHIFATASLICGKYNSTFRMHLPLHFILINKISFPVFQIILYCMGMNISCYGLTFYASYHQYSGYKM
jgi:hypothetical protein